MLKFKKVIEPITKKEYKTIREKPFYHLELMISVKEKKLWINQKNFLMQ